MGKRTFFRGGGRDRKGIVMQYHKECIKCCKYTTTFLANEVLLIFSAQGQLVFKSGQNYLNQTFFIIKTFH